MKKKKIKPITLHDATITDDSKLRKITIIASLGNAMKWFDFGVYGFVAYILGKVFFPGADPSVQMVAVLATFSAPFLIRPLGGLLFDMLGDKYGRQKILAITIVIVSVSTFCIGLILFYDTTGIWAPILLLICKMAQGFSVGGEYTGASIFVVEHSPDRKRGFIGSWLDFDSIAGSMLGAGVAVLISTIVGEENFLDWGWRIPFSTALPLGIIGPYLRHALEETPASQQHVDKLEQGDREGLQDDPKISFKEVATKHWCSLLTCIGLVIVTNVTYYMLLTYTLSYLSHNLYYFKDHGVLIIITVMVGALFVQPVMGLLSDRFDRRPLALLDSVALPVLAIPAFILANSSVIGLILAGLLILAVILNCFTGVMASTLLVMFPTHIRYSALVAAFSISVLVAGLTSTLATQLAESSQNLMMPVYYLMVVVVVGLTTGVAMKETANRPLKGATSAASDIQEAKEILVEYYDNIEQKIDDIGHRIVDLQAKCTCLAQQHPRIDK